MGESIFSEGGPYNIKRTGKDEFSMGVGIPVDTDGLIGRECPNDTCSPGYFKVKPGTGITGNQSKAYCPYCRSEEDPNSFSTKAQIEYAKQIVLHEAIKGINTSFQNALDIGPSGKKSYGSGLLSIDMSFKPCDLPPVRPPMEEVLRRDIICPSCGLEHAVFGLATWCPDCGQDIFITHVAKEFDAIIKMLGDVNRRRNLLGARVAARDIENALEDVVSIFEAAMRAMTRRKIKKLGFLDDQVQEKLRKIGNKYQNVELARQVCEDEFKIQLLDNLDSKQIESFRMTFEKRHPITHNLGIIDRKYLDRIRLIETEGRDVNVTPEEIIITIDLAIQILKQVHGQLFFSKP